jgi:type II secretory pathway component PulF
VIWALGHSFEWIGVAFVITCAVPCFSTTFRTFHLKVPNPTQMVVAISTWLVDRFWIVALIFPSFFVVDSWLLYFFRVNSATRHLSRFWCVSMCVLPLAMAVMLGIAILLPLLLKEMEK